jgi:toxin ParE1/3/4
MLLAGNPEIGRLRPELSVQGLRSFPVQTHVIFYLAQQDGIEVVRVLHGSRDIPSLI